MINSINLKQGYLKSGVKNQNHKNKDIEQEKLGFSSLRNNITRVGTPLALSLTVMGCVKDEYSTVNRNIPAENSLDYFQPANEYRPTVQDLEYYTSVASGSEYKGGVEYESTGNEPINKFAPGDINLCISGDPSPNGINPGNRDFLENSAIPQINAVTAPNNTLKIIAPNYNNPVPNQFQDKNCDISISFMPMEQVQDYSKIKGTMAYASIDQINGNTIEHSQVYIGTGGNDAGPYITEQDTANHIILEELIQSLGLAKDHEGSPDSVFYQYLPENPPTKLNQNDQIAVAIHASPQIQPGMTKDQIMQLANDPNFRVRIPGGASVVTELTPVETSFSQPQRVAVPQNTSVPIGTPVSLPPVEVIPENSSIRQTARNLALRGLVWLNNKTRVEGTEEPYTIQPLPAQSAIQSQTAQFLTLTPAEVGENAAKSGGDVNACYSTLEPAVCIGAYNNQLRGAK